MKIDISRVVSWAAEVEDRPGAAAEKLKFLSEASFQSTEDTSKAMRILKNNEDRF